MEDSLSPTRWGTMRVGKFLNEFFCGLSLFPQLMKLADNILVCKIFSVVLKTLKEINIKEEFFSVIFFLLFQGAVHLLS